MCLAVLDGDVHIVTLRLTLDFGLGGNGWGGFSLLRWRLVVKLTVQFDEQQEIRGEKAKSEIGG